jgi:hypothetical protein
LVSYLPRLRGEIALWEWGHKLLSLKDEEEPLGLLFVSKSTELGYLANLKPSRLYRGKRLGWSQRIQDLDLAYG